MIRAGTPLTDAELLGRLVAFDSTSARSNLPIADFVCDYLAGPDVEIVRNASESGDKVNVVAMKGPASGPPGRGLILCGHLDTVPATEPEWTSDPFTVVERGGSYFGRGTADMKGFDALAVNAFREADPAALDAPLVLLLTYDEEVGSLGARRFVDTWPGDRPLPQNAIIGEPTSLQAVRMHKGHLKMRVTVRGRAAHSGSPHLGVNAIEPAALLLGELAVLRERLERESAPFGAFFPDVPYSVLTVARIRGGQALNVIPELCVIDIGVRLLPGADAEAVVGSVQAAARSIEGEVTASFEVTGDNPPLLTHEEAPVHRGLCEMLGQTGTVGVSFASDGGWLSTRDIDCVLWGPGTIEVAHKPDEHLPVADFVRARGLLDRFVRRWCGAANEGA